MLCLWNLPIFPAVIIVCSFFIAVWYSTVCICYNVSDNSTAEGCLGCFPWRVRAITSNAAGISLSVHTYGHFCGIYPRVELLGLGSAYALICMILSNHFAKQLYHLHTHQWNMRFPVAQHLCQYLYYQSFKFQLFRWVHNGIRLRF